MWVINMNDGYSGSSKNFEMALNYSRGETNGW